MVDEVKGLIEKISTEIKEVNDAQVAAFEKWQAEIAKNGKATEETGKELKELREKMETLQAEQAAEGKKLLDRVDEMELKGNRPGIGGKGEQMLTIGEQYIQNEEVKAQIGKNDPNRFPLVEVKHLRQQLQAKALTSADFGELILMPEIYPGVIVPPIRPENIRDLFTVVATQQGSIAYAVETGFVNAAAAVAESGEKPESDITVEQAQVAISTIAHHMTLSRQVLADSSMLRAYINGRLLDGLKLTEDRDLLYGNGINPNIEGILSNAAIQHYLWSGGPLGTDTQVDAIRRAMTLVQLAEYRPDGVVVNPVDWEAIELTKGNDDHYVYGVMMEQGGRKLFWSVPVLVSTAINAGTALTGAFKNGGYVWDREQAFIRVSEHHDKNFTKNLITVLAEERLALTIFRPESFVEITLDNAPAS